MNAQHHISRAELLAEHRRYEAAIAELNKALAIEPENILAIENLGWVYYQSGHFDKATEYARQLITARPDYYVGYYYLAIIAGGRGNAAEARIQLQEALYLRPTWAPLYGYKGKTYLLEANWKKAEKAAREGLAVDADDLYCQKILNQALAKLNDAEEYDKALRITLDKAPNDAQTHIMAGWHELKTGSAKKAYEHFIAALHNDPTSVRSRTGIVESVKSKFFLYRLFLKFDLWMASNTKSFQRGSMFLICLLYLWIGEIIGGSYIGLWRAVLVTTAIPFLLMWVVKWLADMVILGFNKKHNKYIIVKRPTLKGFTDIGYSLVFFLVSISLLWEWLSPVSNTLLVLGWTLLLFTHSWRKYIHSNFDEKQVQLIVASAVSSGVTFTLIWYFAGNSIQMSLSSSVGYFIAEAILYFRKK